MTLADIRLVLEAAAWIMRDPAIPWAQLNLPEMVDLQRELRAWQGLTYGPLDFGYDGLQE